MGEPATAAGWGSGGAARAARPPAPWPRWRCGNLQCGAVLPYGRITTTGQDSGLEPLPNRRVQTSEHPIRAAPAATCARSSARSAGSVVEIHNETVAAALRPATPPASPLPTQPGFAGPAAPNRSGPPQRPSGRDQRRRGLPPPTQGAESIIETRRSPGCPPDGERPRACPGGRHRPTPARRLGRARR